MSHLESTFFLILLQLFHSDFQVQQTTSHLSHLLWSEMGKSFTTMTLEMFSFFLIVFLYEWISSVLGEMLNELSNFTDKNVIHSLAIPQVYFWVIGSNLILRCTWTYKLSAHLRHNYLTVFAITALEIIRRFQWVFFRVENEWNKMTSKSNIQLSMIDIPGEEDKLLGSNGYNV